MKIAEAKNKTSKKWRTHSITWEEFLSRIRDPYRTAETMREYKAMGKAERDAAKEAKGGFVGGALTGGQRKTENVKERWLITLDADEAVPGQWESVTLLHDFCMAVYSTHSHTEENPRLRWIIPTDRAMTPDEYPAVARKVAGWLGIETMDPTTYEVARLMYWPTCSEDADYYFRQQEGPELKVDEVLAEYGDNEAWRDTSLWPIAKKESEVRIRAIKKAGDPTEKNGIVGLFCRTYDVEDVIAEFLPDVYTECNTPGRYTFAGGSTFGGAIVYDEGRFLYSNHATDPCQGMSVNAFDLVRIHKYGAMDADMGEDVPVTKLPSYGEMVRFAAELPEVKAKMVQERTAEADSDFADLLNTTGEDDSGWENNLVLNSKTGECEPSINNALLILTHDPALKGAFGYDKFAERPKLLKDVPWRPKGSVSTEGRGTDWEDRDDFGAKWHLQLNWKFKSENDFRAALELAFHARAFHPVRDYLKSLTWDGVPRVETMFTRLFGAEDTELNRAISRKWMAGAVARVMRPGCKFDNCLVLYGQQNLGKSSFADVLSKGWFNDSDINIGNKDGYASLHGSWIIELAELASVKRSDVESVKTFLSKREDTYRPAYGRRVATFPRQCVFFGTTNELEFLRDRTGNRRFWPIEVSHGMNRARLEAEVDQLWAEAYVIWKGGENIWMDTKHLEALLAEALDEHMVQDELVGQLSDFLDTPLPKNWYDLKPETRRDYIQGDTVADTTRDTMRRDSVCISEIRVEMCGEDRRRNGGNDLLSRRLANLMNTMPGWRKGRKKERTKGYGIQWVYRRELPLQT